MPSFITITYSVLLNGRRAKGVFELDFDKMTRSQIVSGIVNGEFDGIAHVFECDPQEHTCDDITHDIARAVYSQLAKQGDKCPEALRDWLSEHAELMAPNKLDYAATGECAA